MRSPPVGRDRLPSCLVPPLPLALSDFPFPCFDFPFPLALPPPEGRRLESSSVEKSAAGLDRARCDWGVVFFATPIIPAGRTGAGCASSSRLDHRPLFAAAASIDIGATLFIEGAHSSSRRTFAGGLDDVLPDVPVNPVLICSAGDVDSDAVDGALIGALCRTTPASPQLISSSG